MNKSELAAAISSATGLSKAEAMAMVDHFIAGISDALQKGDRVNLPGFGSFAIQERSARTGRNPRTNEEIQIPAKKIVKFKPGKSFDLS